MPAAPGPRPDQIQQPVGTAPGDVMTATASGSPVFASPAGTGATGPTGPPGTGSGASTGLISHHIPISTATLGVTPPDSGLAGDIPISIYVEGQERGEKLEFAIPNDYVSGNIDLLATYRMSTNDTGPVGIVLLEADVSIADTLNGIVVTATGPQVIEFNPIDTTGFEHQVVLSILEGSFSPGDVVVIDLKRLGDQPTAGDSHDGNWEVAAFTYRYTGQVATRVSTQVAEFFLATDEPSPPNGTLGAIPTSDYPSGSDAEQKASFVIPDNWDLFTDAQFTVTYAMDTAELGSEIALETEGSVADVLSGALDSLPVAAFDIIPSDDIGPHRSVAIRSISGTELAIGDVITLKVARRTSGTNNHGGIFKLINISMTIGQASSIVEVTGTDPGVGEGGEVRRYSLFRDEKPQGTNGGNNTANVWETRDLNTEVVDVGSNVTLAANQFTLEPGVYEISASAPSRNMNNHRIRLRNITDNVTTIAGPNSGSAGSISGPRINHAFVHGRFVITSSKIFEIQHRGTNAGGSGTAFGLPQNIPGANEVYTEVQLYKVENAGVGVSTTYDHLATGIFELVNGTVSGDTDAPTLGGDFQAWDTLTSTTPAGEIHVSYEGRVSPEQTEITSIDVPIKGTGDYAIKVYVDGALTSNPVFDSGIQVAPATRTIVTITNLDLPEQPTGEGRYFVVVEAFVDAGENVRVGLPFVRQD